MNQTGALAIGQGRKPKSSHEKWLEGEAGKRGGGRKGALSDELPVPPAPSNLTSVQKEIWDELAPAACKMRTLTTEMLPAFREVVEMVAVKRRMYGRIQRDGFMIGKRVHPLLASYRAFLQMVQIGMHRFRLAPIGKEVIPGITVSDGDDWDECDDPPVV